MPSLLHKAHSRGHANHGWLNSYHSFSFAQYHNPKRMNFGVLRVLNDDTVAAGMGFSKHPHQNMEIISIPLEGDLEHKDSLGNTAIIRKGEVQLMSAGSGVFHSEKNKSHKQPVKFLQIWVLPNKENVPPRYDQISLKQLEKNNSFYQIISPSSEDQGLWIHQEAWFSIGQFDAQKEGYYKVHKPNNGLYIFVLEGSIDINGQALNKRDGYGLWGIKELHVQAKSQTRVLLMEIPMNL